MTKRPPRPPQRRSFLTAAIAGATLTSCSSTSPESKVADEEPSRLGKPPGAYGERSKYVKTARQAQDKKNPEAGSSRTPLADTYGILTPAALHFERHHAGIPEIDPAEHRLLIHGLVDRPLVLTLAEIERLPSVSRIHFVECSGNSGGEWGGKGGASVQSSHGLASCSEWTGVPLKTLLEEAGLQSGAKWLIAEGADACRMSRSVPIAKALDDALVVYGQNGEPIRPGQGYPLRLLLPGWEGNISVKWLRQIKVTAEPYMTKDETSKYTDLMADGKARLFTWDMDAKSVITQPSGGRKLAGAGLYEISGLAWSGRGRIERVDISTDGGKTWLKAELQEPRHAKAFTRFRLPWEWNGSPVTLESRCTDDSGYTQPTRAELVAARGPNSLYHYNGIKRWQVEADGSVKNVEA